MAVKQHVVESGQNPEIQPTQTKFEIESFLILIGTIQEKIENGIDVGNDCHHFVKALSKIFIPNDADNIKLVKENIEKIKTNLIELCQKGNNEPIDLSQLFLQILYEIIRITDDPNDISPAVSIILELFDDINIKSTVDFIVKKEESNDNMITKTIIFLRICLTKMHFANNLSTWIATFFDSLNNHNKNELLEKILKNVFDRIFHLLKIPVFRDQISHVVIYILFYFRQSKMWYDLIVNKKFPAIADVLRLQYQKTENQRATIDKIITIIALLIHLNEPPTNIENKIKETFSSFPIPNQLLLNNSLKSKVSQSYNTNSLYLNHFSNDTNLKVGLVNLGNTCYMNSVLQALVMTKRFCREILTTQIKQLLWNKVQQLLVLMLHSKRPELTPREFLNVAKPQGFSLGHQQDSSEFLGYLLQSLHEQEKLYNKEKITMETDEYGDSDKCRNAIIEDTAVRKSFGGQISIKHKCLTCNTVNEVVDPFYDLQLSFSDIGSETNYTVQYLLDIYCRAEKLQGNNKYSCDKCKTLCDGERYANIIKAPTNLILVLKYFKYDQKYNIRAKLMHKIDLDDIIYMKMENCTIKYRLYAGVIHSGVSMDSGHYYTYGADKPNSWFKFNDNYVTKTSLIDLQKLTPPSTPYILFYQMVSCEDNTDAPQCSYSNEIDNNKVPNLEDLPIYLRDVVHKDNSTYTEEVIGRLTKSKNNF